MPLMGGAIAGGGALIGGIGGAMMASDAQEEANAQAAKYRQAALEQLANVGQYIPTLESQKLTYRPQDLVGEYTPAARQEGITSGPSALQGITTDPRLANAQIQALAQMQQLSQSGLSAGDLAALQQTQNQVNQNAQAQQNAIIQNLAQRGMGGSGVELASRLAGQQQQAQQQQNLALQIPQQAQARALQAMQQQAQLGGQMQAQSFNQQAQQGTAADAIARFNALQHTGAQQYNVQAQNQAALRRADLQQRLAEGNITRQDYLEQIEKITNPQQQFQNQYNLASAKANALGGQASAAMNQGAQQASMYGQMGSAISGAAGAIGGALVSNKSSTPSSGGYDPGNDVLALQSPSASVGGLKNPY